MQQLNLGNEDTEKESNQNQPDNITQPTPPEIPFNKEFLNHNTEEELSEPNFPEERPKEDEPDPSP